MIKACFQICKELTISFINTLLNIFRNESLLNFVKKEIKLFLDELPKEKCLVVCLSSRISDRVDYPESSTWAV